MSGQLVLVTGAGGYIGGRLVPLLLDAGYRVRVLVRHPERIRETPWFSRVQVVAGDAHDAAAVTEALTDVDVAYFLMHSIQSDDLESSERKMSQNFARCAREQGVSRIIYLGGLIPDAPTHQMSAHMRSRNQVGETLRASGVPTIELRASMIIGSGSASFEMLRYITERLPAMITPRWVRQLTQPIAIRDVLRYLVLAADLPGTINRSFDIGGPDVLSYQAMMQTYARVAGLPPRVILPVNVLTPRLSSHWVGLVTPVPRSIAKPLIRSLIHPAVCHDDDIKQLIPDPENGLLTLSEAISLALQRIQDAEVATRWSSASYKGAPSDPLPSDPDWTGGSLYTDVRTVTTKKSPEKVWAALERIGGETGYYSADFLWHVRGVLDRLIGGAGLRRGRRDPEQLIVGDAVDFWRVEERIPGKLLRLRAEMKMPGLAWLEFTITPREDGGSILTQRAVYVPHGLSGHAYWWSVAPFHRFVFPGMAKGIIQSST